MQNERFWGPRVCVLSSYGSPTGGLDSFGPGSPLGYLGVPKRVLITVSTVKHLPSISLFYSRADNQQTIRLVNSEMARLQTRLRHVDIHNHWVRVTSERCIRGGHTGIKIASEFNHKVLRAATWRAAFLES